MSRLAKRSGSCAVAVLGIALLVGCADDPNAGPAMGSASASPPSTSTAAVAGMPAPAVSAVGPTGRAGTAAAESGGAAPSTPALGSAGLGAAGMMAAAAAGGGACSNASADTDRDGTPDCMDMCAMDPAKTAPGTCGCGKLESEGCTAMAPQMPGAAEAEACIVGAIPDDVRKEYELDPFYTRYASAAGTPIVATDKPEDEAIRRACFVVLDLSSTHPKAREGMRTGHVYFIMMAKSEKTVETPEYRSRGDLDRRARGFGNNPGLCAEENVMCDTMTDRWRGESICVHEYSHVMHLYVWSEIDPTFDDKVNAAFENATRTMGKYSNTYADDNAMEYLAEGVQNWYNTNLESRQGEAGDGVHNHINTREEFKAYDPMLYDLLATVLPDVPAYEDCYYYGEK